MFEGSACADSGSARMNGPLVGRVSAFLAVGNGMENMGCADSPTGGFHNGCFSCLLAAMVQLKEKGSVALLLPTFLLSRISHLLCPKPQEMVSSWVVHPILIFLRHYDPPSSAEGLAVPRGPDGAGDRSQAADDSECRPDPGAQAGRAAEALPAHGGAGPLFPPGAAATGGLRPQGHWALLMASS